MRRLHDCLVTIILDSWNPSSFSLDSYSLSFAINPLTLLNLSLRWHLHVGSFLVSFLSSSLSSLSLSFIFSFFLFSYSLSFSFSFFFFFILSLSFSFILLWNYTLFLFIFSLSSFSYFFSLL